MRVGRALLVERKHARRALAPPHSARRVPRHARMHMHMPCTGTRTTYSTGLRARPVQRSLTLPITSRSRAQIPDQSAHVRTVPPHETRTNTTQHTRSPTEGRLAGLSASPLTYHTKHARGYRRADMRGWSDGMPSPTREAPSPHGRQRHEYTRPVHTHSHATGSPLIKCAPQARARRLGRVGRERANTV